MPEPRRIVPSVRVLGSGATARRARRFLSAAGWLGPAVAVGFVVLAPGSIAQAQYAVGPGRSPPTTGTVPGARQLPVGPPQVVSGLEATLLLQRQLLYAQALLLSSQQAAALQAAGVYAAANAGSPPAMSLSTPGLTSPAAVAEPPPSVPLPDLAPGTVPPPPPKAAAAALVRVASEPAPASPTSGGSRGTAASSSAEVVADAKGASLTLPLADAGTLATEASTVEAPAPAPPEVPGAVTLAEYLEPLAAAATAATAAAHPPPHPGVAASPALVSRATLPRLEGPLGGQDFMAVASRPFSSVTARLGVVLAAVLLIGLALAFTGGRREPPA